MPRILRKAAKHYQPSGRMVRWSDYFRAEKEKSSSWCRKRSSRSCIYNFRDKLILTTVIIITVKNNKTVLKKELRLCRLVNNALECYDAQLKPWTSIVSSLLLYFKRLRKRYNVQTECRDRDTRFRFQNPLDILILPYLYWIRPSCRISMGRLRSLQAWLLSSCCSARKYVCQW